MAFNYNFIKDIFDDHKANKTNKEIQESYGFGSNVVNIYINSFKVISEHYEKSLAAAALDKLDLEKQLSNLENDLKYFDKNPLISLELENQKQQQQIVSLKSSVSSAEDKLYYSKESIRDYRDQMSNVPNWVYDFFSKLKRA